MDQAFLLRARRLLEQRPLARLAYAELLAAVVRQRGLSPTARFAAAAERSAAAGGALAALTNLLLSDVEAGPEPAEGRHACFNRAVATRPGKDR